MRITDRHASLALASAVVLTLGGCLAPSPKIDSPPQPTSDPVFANDEEALAAATDAYAAYQTAVNVISRDGGASPERITHLVTAERLRVEIEGFNALRQSRRYLSGVVRVKDTALQQIYESEDGMTVIVIYVCVDPTEAQILDAMGLDITPPSMHSLWPREATFEIRAESNGPPVLAGEEPWSDNGFC